MNIRKSPAGSNVEWIDRNGTKQVLLCLFELKINKDEFGRNRSKHQIITYMIFGNKIQIWRNLSFHVATSCVTRNEVKDIALNDFNVSNEEITVERNRLFQEFDRGFQI